MISAKSSSLSAGFTTYFFFFYDLFLSLFSYFSN